MLLFFMMKVEDVKKLAELARIEVSEGETESLTNDISAILDYVKEIENAPKGEGQWEPENRNVFREDEITNLSGEYTDDILDQAPERSGNYFKVKKIL